MKTLLSCCCFLYFVTWIAGQNPIPIPTNAKLKVTMNITEHISYELLDSSQLEVSDIITIKSSSEKTKLTYYLTADSQSVYVVDFLESKNKWPNEAQPWKRVMFSADTTVYYDQNYNVAFATGQSKAFALQSLLLDFSSNYDVFNFNKEFIPLTPSQISQLTMSGYFVTQTPSKQRIVNPDGTIDLTTDFVNKSMTEKLFDNGALTSTDKRVFKANSTNTMLPIYSQTKNEIILPSGKCARRNHLKFYDNIIKLSLNTSQRQKEGEQKACSYAFSTDQSSFVKINRTCENQSDIENNIQAQIINFSGHIELVKDLSKNFTEEIINISNWPSGLYILSISNGNSLENYKFFKTN